MEENKEKTDNLQDMEVVGEQNKGSVMAVQAELEETTDRLKRLMAEFDNYKKRSAKDRETLYNSLISDILVAFLPIIDNLEKAIEVETTDEKYKEGITLVLKQFLDILKNYGVEAIKTVGEPFDPELHEAVSHIEDKNLGEKVVAAELRKGYRIGSKVVRYAMVSVAN